MKELPPVVDVTTIVGVESLFHGRERDPWGQLLAGALADMFIYSDRLRFTLPRSGTATTTLEQEHLPSLLSILSARDSEALTPVVYETSMSRTLSVDFLALAFDNFSDWARNSAPALLRWLRLHREVWVRQGHIARVRQHFVFDLEALSSSPKLDRLSSLLRIHKKELLYAFDIFLRYPLYGELAGPGAYLLAHPIRHLPRFPTMTNVPAPPPEVPLSFARAVSAMAASMNLDQFTSFLHLARGVVRDRRIHALKPGALDHETTREIAALVGLPARLSAAGKFMGVSAGIIGAIGAIPALGPPAALAGAVVSVASSLWTGTVGQSASRKSWLRWALRWDVEDQASQR